MCRKCNQIFFYFFNGATRGWWGPTPPGGEGGWRKAERSVPSCTYFCGVNGSSFYARWTCNEKDRLFPVSLEATFLGGGCRLRLHPILIEFEEGQGFEQNHSPSYLDKDWMFSDRIEHLRMPMESVPDSIDVCKVAFTRSTKNMSHSTCCPCHDMTRVKTRQCSTTIVKNDKF